MSPWMCVCECCGGILSLSLIALLNWLKMTVLNGRMVSFMELCGVLLDIKDTSY